MIDTGETRVLCSASVEHNVPQFLKGTGQGWVTAEYGMLPRSTVTRNAREISKPRGRTQEIQRLIGRSLRAAIDLESIGEITVTVDCDVIQADGGTRTAAITGGYVALFQAFQSMVKREELPGLPIKSGVAAVSVGIVDGLVLLDLNYEEDSKADVDFNIVMTDQSKFVEIQGTAEQESFSKSLLDEMLTVSANGINQLHKIQKDICKIPE